METAEGVANFFVDKAAEANRYDLSQLKLQKLVYFAHGWNLGLGGEGLFAEPVLAWRYGPVIRSLRSAFRDFGYRSINRRAQALRYTSDGQFQEYDYALNNRASVMPLLDRIWDIYGKFSPVQLTNMTHEAGTPWHQIAAHYQFQIPSGVTIPNDLIRDYFQKLAGRSPMPTST